MPRGRRSKAGTLDGPLQFVTRASSRERRARRLPAIAMARPCRDGFGIASVYARPALSKALFSFLGARCHSPLAGLPKSLSIAARTAHRANTLRQSLTAQPTVAGNGRTIAPSAIDG
ncbi:hypothetical protein WS67_00505 [Burkholderia singularis]|uniref:Uncharacterized protein n=1 Tax=Burkholderia singularis TaxID=1503053 RepID=A0A103E7D1_9BURK|nr:hypothetical protein WS67_00505 [Burkholderia singularis]